MVTPNHILTGKARGRFIELDRDLGLPDGEVVNIRIEEKKKNGGDPQPSKSSTGDGFRRSAGAWADDMEGLDRFVEETYRARLDQRTDTSE